EDEASMAATGAMEGSAQYYSSQVAARFLSPQELLSAAQSALAQGVPTGVPPFIEQMELWPYQAGLSFITSLHGTGGNRAVDQALQHFPTSTEQVIHPERYPNDQPQPLDI